jgi:hypothetical protein
MSKINQEIKLSKQGFSSYQIGKMLNLTPAAVRANLRRHKLNKKGIGIIIEDKVEEWFTNNGYKVKRQKGDAFFDMSINGEKADVKCANISFDRFHNNGFYKFQLCDMSNRSNYKDFNEIDYFLLVFLDIDGQPIYRLNSAEITAKNTLSIPEKLNTKYGLNLIGYLQKGGICQKQ